MIYEFSNFVDSYDNADGESKERMAISQFSKILGQSPKTIEVAISDADIDVPTGASKQDLIQIIRENKDNENLRDHLGTLVLVQAKGEGEGLNFFGKKADGTQRKEQFLLLTELHQQQVELKRKVGLKVYLVLTKTQKQEQNNQVNLEVGLKVIQRELQI